MKMKLKKRSFLDKFSYSNRNTNIFLVSTFLILLFCLTIGYSVLSNVLSIKGDIAVRPTKDIRITSVTGPVMANGAYENTNFRFSHDLLSVNGVLPNDNSTLTYTITIKNNGTSDMDLTDIINTCNDSNIYYELNGIKLGDTIEAGTSITFTLTLKTSSGSNNAFNCQLKFVFEQSYMDITAPEITFEPIASNTCNSSSFDVTVIATDDIEVKTFLWCQTTGNNSSCTPTNIVESNQKEVSKVITINTDDKYHVICVQAVDGSKYGPNFNIKCSNEEGNYYSLDTTGPEISNNITPTTADGSNGWYKTLPVVNITGTDLGCGTYTGYKYQTSIDGNAYSALSTLQTNDNSLNSVIASNECKTIQYKVTGYDGNNNSSSTYTSNSFKYDKTAPVITVDGHTSDYSVEYEPVTTYENGTAVYYNPETGQKCDDYTESQSTGTAKTGCLKWYIFNDDANNDTVDMILDHNTTYKVAWNSSGSNVNGPSEALTSLQSDTSSWSGVPTRSDSYTDPLKGYTIDYSGYRARLIEANEIAKITGADTALQWDSGKPFADDTPTKGTHSSYYYFDGAYGTDSIWQTQVATSTGASHYAWLFDYTKGCTSYGCNTANSGTYGYWTSSASASRSYYAWHVTASGRVGYDNVGSVARGLRPVITISKSNLS